MDSSSLPPSESKANPRQTYYDILGCSETSTVEQINAEYRHRALLTHPDKCSTCDDTAGQFQRLQLAKETLADPERRRVYDQWLRSGLDLTFAQWQSLSNRSHIAMHFSSGKQDAHVLTHSSHTPKDFEEDQSPESRATLSPDNMYEHQRSSAADIRKAFRNYVI